MAISSRRPVMAFRKWRQFREMSQEDAAADLGMDRSNLSKIERGVIPYDSDFVAAGARLYRCSERDFQYRDPFATETIPIEAITDLSKDQQDQLRAIIATFPRRR